MNRAVGRWYRCHPKPHSRCHAWKPPFESLEVSFESRLVPLPNHSWRPSFQSCGWRRITKRKTNYKWMVTANVGNYEWLINSPYSSDSSINDFNNYSKDREECSGEVRRGLSIRNKGLSIIVGDKLGRLEELLNGNC